MAIEVSNQDVEEAGAKEGLGVDLILCATCEPLVEFLVADYESLKQENSDG